ncbi:uncharacterized protein FA14DRAFT_181581 [Meira miltonrushii]|uniref:Uncharacterized protein n=1 Tax=Meira miltonrushii TaxID=1280837 RepID=A0A316V5Q2_9BASI|nr:uncharacterized protein FA14DRAFT_181581 [Meira miltonrushii]PWN32907.1 hypothetical protein FA14DRAFT_181581 [Meira miltonrushii]
MAFFMAMFTAMQHLCVGNMAIEPDPNFQQLKMWKRARTPYPHSPTHSSSSVEVYSPVRSTGHIYQDAYYDPFASHHDPTRWTPPPSSPIPDRPTSPIRTTSEKSVSKPKRKYTRKSSTIRKEQNNDEEQAIGKTTMKKEKKEPLIDKRKMTLTRSESSQPTKLKQEQNFKRYEELTNKPADQLEKEEYEFVRKYERTSKRRASHRRYYIDFLAKRASTSSDVDFSTEQASMSPSSMYHDAYYDPFSIEHHGEPTIYPPEKKGNKRKRSRSSKKSSKDSCNTPAGTGDTQNAQEKPKPRRKRNLKQEKIRSKRYYQNHKEEMKAKSRDNYHRRMKAEGKESIGVKYPRFPK